MGALYTAVRLENLLWPDGRKPQVTLIDQSERFVFKPLLYELLNGGARADEVAPPFSQLLAPYSVNFIQARMMCLAASCISLLHVLLGSVVSKLCMLSARGASSLWRQASQSQAMAASPQQVSSL